MRTKRKLYIAIVAAAHGLEHAATVRNPFGQTVLTVTHERRGPGRPFTFKDGAGKDISEETYEVIRNAEAK